MNSNLLTGSLHRTLLLHQCLAAAATTRRRRGSGPLIMSRGDLGDTMRCLVEDIARDTALGHDQVLALGSGRPDSGPTDCVRKDGRILVVHDTRRIRVAADKHCPAKSDKDLTAHSEERIGNLETETGAIDVCMPVWRYM